MWPLKIFVIVNTFSVVSSIAEMLNEGKFCDLLSEATYKQCYVKETLAKLGHSPNQLAVDHQTNTLYFSIDFGRGEYVAAALKLDNKKLTVLQGVKDAFAIAYDATDGEVYFGGGHGIYKYNSTRGILKRLKVNGLDIWWLVVKHRIYFIKFPSLRIYYYANKTVYVVPELRNYIVNQFVFDKHDNIIFINNTGLYGIHHDHGNVVLLKEKTIFLSLAVNKAGHVHLSGDNGIYVFSEMVHKVKKIISVTGVLGMTFDKDDNIIYSDSRELVRLKLISKTKI